MSAKQANAFDVWFVVANTVYKGVPYNVVADWAQQGRLAGTDMVRPAGSNRTWFCVAEDELLADYLPRSATNAPAKPTPGPDAPTAPAAVTTAAPAQALELPDPEPGPSVSRFEDDDDVDMIPLIDISMVLLVFFIIIQAASALAPVDVPEMRYGGVLSNDPNAITITIDKLNDTDVFYSVRVGPAPPLPKYEKLKTPEEALAALTDSLQKTTRAPEVRIACRKDLPRERVYELRRELEPLRVKEPPVINNIVATVVEAPEK